MSITIPAFVWYVLIGVVIGWLLFKRPDFISKGVAWVKAKLFGNAAG